jgi:hypothetical protein
VQRAEEEEEEPVQGSFVQREAPEEEEEQVQGSFVQRLSVQRHGDDTEVEPAG